MMLPADTNLDHSYFRYVIFDGIDFTGYSLRDADFINCRCRNVILPSHEIDNIPATAWLHSRFTDWEDAVLPLNFSSYNHDLVRELQRKIVANPAMPARVRAAANSARIYLGDVYGRSWQDTMYHVMNDLSITPRQFFQAVQTGYGPYLKLFTRSMHFQRPEDAKVDSPDIGSDLTQVRLGRIVYNIKQRVDPDRLAPDRFWIARFLENAARDEASQDLQFYVAQLLPKPLILWDRPEAPDFWWQSAWPN
jgi:hypothetical protein